MNNANRFLSNNCIYIQYFKISTLEKITPNFPCLFRQTNTKACEVQKNMFIYSIINSKGQTHDICYTFRKFLFLKTVLYLPGIMVLADNRRRRFMALNLYSIHMINKLLRPYNNLRFFVTNFSITKQSMKNLQKFAKSIKCHASGKHTVWCIVCPVLYNKSNN